MCYQIRCGGALSGAVIVTLTAREAIHQAAKLEAMGATAVAFFKRHEERVTYFEVQLFAVDEPIRMKT